MGMQGREGIIAGLRELADFLDANPAVPHPTFDGEILVYATEDELRAAAHVSGRWNKEFNADWIHLEREFSGGVTLSVFTNRKGICEPKRTSTEIVDEPDSEWLRAEIAKLKEVQPTKKVERTTVEEWECAPLLAAPVSVPDIAIEIDEFAEEPF